MHCTYNMAKMKNNTIFFVDETITFITMTSLIQGANKSIGTIMVSVLFYNDMSPEDVEFPHFIHN
jgi:hypothetical protein